MVINGQWISDRLVMDIGSMGGIRMGYGVIRTRHMMTSEAGYQYPTHPIYRMV